MVRWLKFCPIVIICLFMLSTSVWADNPYRVYIDGKQLPLSSDPVNVNDSLLVPMRDLFQGLGAQVTWDEGSQRVYAVKDKMLLILPLNSDYVYFNQRSVKLTVQARLINERTFVPLRFVSSIFGSEVDYDPISGRINITSQAAPLDDNAAKRLALLNDFVANTNQITSYEAALTGKYDITLGDKTIPVTLQADARVASDTEMAMKYRLSSALAPSALLDGNMVMANGKLYLQSGDNPWSMQALGSDAGNSTVLRAVLSSVANGNLETLPLADMFGSTMVPKDDFLQQAQEKGLIRELNDLGTQDVEGKSLQGVQLVFSPERFAYYFSNIGGSNPQAQGKVLDNVHSLNLVINYWASAEDKLIYKTEFALQMVMKADPHTPTPSVFSLQMTQIIKSPNQAITVTIPQGI